jgi:hypothetical protein
MGAVSKPTIGDRMTPDFINGALELIGSFMLWANVLRLHRDKKTHGVTWYATGFFMGWGYWNLYYYPSLGQWWSFSGGVSLVLANTIWLGQMLYYRRRILWVDETHLNL